MLDGLARHWIPGSTNQAGQYGQVGQTFSHYGWCFMDAVPQKIPPSFG